MAFYIMKKSIIKKKIKLKLTMYEKMFHININILIKNVYSLK